jgi:hypothetical protein
MSTIVSITNTSLGSTCYATEQARLNDYVNHMLATFPATFTGLHVGPSAPTGGENAWFKTTLDGATYYPDKLYYYNGSQWLAKHPIFEGAIWMYYGSIASIDTFDGGSAGAITAVTGPMWAEVAGMRAKFPVGVGAFLSGTTVAAQGTGGLEDVTLIENQIPSHTHGFTVIAQSLGADGSGQLTGGGEFNANDGSYTGTTTATGGGLSHTNLPPYYGVYFLRKTARLYYVTT